MGVGNPRGTLGRGSQAPAAEETPLWGPCPLGPCSFPGDSWSTLATAHLTQVLGTLCPLD